MSRQPIEWLGGGGNPATHPLTHVRERTHTSAHAHRAHAHAHRARAHAHAHACARVQAQGAGGEATTTTTPPRTHLLHRMSTSARSCPRPPGAWLAHARTHTRTHTRCTWLHDLVCAQEYKREELPEKALRSFKGFRVCDPKTLDPRVCAGVQARGAAGEGTPLDQGFQGSRPQNPNP
jgi:hypothetical protein